MMKMRTRRDFISTAAAGTLAFPSALAQATSASVANSPARKSLIGPDQILVKPQLLTMADLKARKASAVEAVEVVDYVPAHYRGDLFPSPPHANMNPKKAVVVRWRDHPHRLIFSHEGSYAPLIELPSGAGITNEWFVGAKDESELWNQNGRKEKNSFVDIIQSGPDVAWVRWTYFSVRPDDDSQPRFRGTEDWMAFPNGIVLRRMTFRSLMPESIFGFGNHAVWPDILLPVETRLSDVLAADAQYRDFNIAAAADLYSNVEYKLYTSDDYEIRRVGNNETLNRISNSPGCMLFTPFKEATIFSAIGAKSGANPRYSRVFDVLEVLKAKYAEVDDHWPIGWINAQVHERSPAAKDHPKLMCSGVVQSFFSDGKIPDSWGDDNPTEFNIDVLKWIECHVFYSLTGAVSDPSVARRTAKAWLDLGDGCIDLAKVAEL